jgi:hypothetical protein
MNHTEETLADALARAIKEARSFQLTNHEFASTTALSVALRLRDEWTPDDCAAAAVLADRLRDTCRDMAAIGDGEKWREEDATIACAAVLLRLAADAAWNAS